MAQELGKDKAITKELELEQGFKLLAENCAETRVPMGRWDDGSNGTMG